MKLRFYLPLLLLVATVGVAAQVSQSDPLIASSKVAVVQTDSGKIQGFIHHGIYTYRGIPYAKAARFMPPEKFPKWEGVRTALTYSYVSPQVNSDHIDDVREFLTPHRYGIPKDDCQNLNVWTPNINDGKKRPVMVWLHGGGFTNGSSIEQVAYDGENLSRKGDVVVVTVNHRLNIVGYLDLSAYGEKYKYSANLGIMDLVAALEWVKANIANFGGDPNNVTIFGQSGGGGKVSTLMATPAAKGLFHRAVIESGSIRRMGMTLVDPKDSKRVAELALQNLGLDSSQVDKLQTMPYVQLYEAGQQALKQISEEKGMKGFFGMPGFMWAPVADGGYIPMQPFGAAAPALSKDIPLLIGTVLNEFPSPMFDPRLKDLDTWTMDQLKAYLQQKYGDKTDAVIAAYKKAYPAMDYHDWLYVDSMFRPGAIVTANMKAGQKGAPVYMYLFTWQSPVMDGMNRSTHCMEIPFVFYNTAITEQVNGGGTDAYAMQEKVAQAWINFARTGDPNNKDLPKWPAYTRENGSVMVLDNTSEVRNRHDNELMLLLAPDAMK